MGGAPWYDTYECVTPVLTFAEASSHPHVAARNTVVNLNGVP